jgi:hypothetical protein
MREEGGGEGGGQTVGGEGGMDRNSARHINEYTLPGEGEGEGVCQAYSRRKISERRFWYRGLYTIHYTVPKNITMLKNSHPF